MNLTVTADDGPILRDVLADLLRDLRREIARTDAKEFRHTLVLRQELIERLLGQVDRGLTSTKPVAHAAQV